MQKPINLKRISQLRVIVIFLILNSALFPQNKNSDKHLYFVQITDSHFDENGSEKRINKIIKSVNQLPMEIECVVHTGDITQEKLHEEEVVERAVFIFDGFNHLLDLLYVSAPISAYWGRQLTYCIYEYKNGKIGYRTQYLQ